MNKVNVAKFAKSVQSSVARHSPEILMGIGIAGMFSTTVLAVKATPKAVRLIEEAEREKEDKLTPVETVKTCWKCYIPAVATGVFATACLIGSSSVHAKRNAALATAYKLSETALSDYRDKVIETIGEKKEREVRDKVAKDRIEKQPVSKSEVIMTDRGNTLCYDYQSGRYFNSDIDRIKKAENNINKRLLNEMYVSLNDFYDELGLSSTALGDELGWNYDGELLELHLSSQLADDGRPCIVVNYNIAPKREYYKFV